MPVLSLPKLRPLEPLEFCQRYSRYTPERWGYKGQWNRLISEVLKISVKTVEGWGDGFRECPQHYKDQLAMVHALIQAKQTLVSLGIDPEIIESQDKPEK